MRKINFTGIKSAVRSCWLQFKRIFRRGTSPGQSKAAGLGGSFRKHGDILLFVLALTVLAAALVHLAVNRKVDQTIPSIVFTQWWKDNLEKDTLQNLAEEFESLHKDIKVVIKETAYEDLRNGLFNPSETSFPGDILALDPLWVPELLKKGIIEQGNEAPILSFIDVLYYNVGILREAGFTRPPKNRSEFIDQLKAVTDKEKSRWGLAMDRNSSRGIYDDVFPWIWSAGTPLINDKKPVVSSRQVVESLSFLASLNKEGLLVPDNLYGNKLEDFFSGRAVFMIAPASNIAVARERMGDDTFGVSSVPSPANYTGKSFYASAAWTAGVNSASAHKEEARLFAEFLSGKASVLSEKARAIPGDNSQPPLLDPMYSKVWDIAIAAEPAQDFVSLPWTELEKTFGEELDALFEEKSSPAEAAALIQKRWEEALSKQ